MEITTDESRCIGAGQCVRAAPDVFDQRDEDGIVVLLDDHPDEARRPQVVNAAARCPAAAIEVIR